MPKEVKKIHEKTHPGVKKSETKNGEKEDSKDNDD
jgi:hypothetical protein